MRGKTRRVLSSEKAKQKFKYKYLFSNCMSCEKDCHSHKKLVGELEEAIAQSGSPIVPASFEQRAVDYCTSCVHDGKVGTGYRRTYRS